MKRSVRVIVLLSLIFAVAIPNLAAEEPEKYPSKPVTMFHAYAAGGSTDLAARAVASVAPKYFSQPIVVVPKPGERDLWLCRFWPRPSRTATPIISDGTAN